MKSSAQRTITTDETIVIERDDLIELVRSKGFDVPDDIQFIVRVPGGGDWSNLDLQIGPGYLLKAKYQTTHITGEKT